MTGRPDLPTGVIAMRQMLDDLDSTHAGPMIYRDAVPRIIDAKSNNSPGPGAASERTPRDPVRIPLGSHRRQFLR
jgi:hypothetical protein